MKSEATFLLHFYFDVCLCYGKLIHEFRVGASVVNLALSMGVTAKTVAIVGVVCTGILSVATGTSWGNIRSMCSQSSCG